MVNVDPPDADHRASAVFKETLWLARPPRRAGEPNLSKQALI